MAKFYADSSSMTFANPVKLEVNSPLDVRLLFETRDALLNYDNPDALYNGIIASYKYLAYAKTDAEGNVTEAAVKNEQKESFQWYETNEPVTGYGRWRQFRTLDQGAIFIMCPFGLPDSPLDGDEKSIHLAPVLGSDGNPVQAPGDNGLPVWEQSVWVVYDPNTGEYRSVREGDDWENMNGKWQSCGSIFLNIDTKAFPSRAEVDGKLDRGEGCEYDSFVEYYTEHRNTHTELENRIGTLEDFKNGFEIGLGDKVDHFSSDLEIKVEFSGGTWGSGSDYTPPTEVSPLP